MLGWSWTFKYCNTGFLKLLPAVSIWSRSSLCYIDTLWITDQHTGRVGIYEFCIYVAILNFLCPVLKDLSALCPQNLVWVFINRNIDVLPFTFPNYITKKLEQYRLSSHSFFSYVDFYYGICMNNDYQQII